MAKASSRNKANANQGSSGSGSTANGHANNKKINGNNSVKSGTTTAAAAAAAAETEEQDDDLPTSHLTRPSPDAILADEADPDTLLGLESDSDAGSSRPASMQPSAKRASKRVSRQLLEVPLSEGEDANVARTDVTPTQTSFATSKKQASLPDLPPPSPEVLQSQVSDLTLQVTSLNNKLVTSFMRVGDLEDEVSQMQETITSYRRQIAELEKERQEHLAALNTGLLVEKEHVSSEMQKMMERLVQETAEKGKAVDERQKIEAELDELSSSLFSEANKMVAVERLARARAEEKSKSMEERLKDTEEIVGEQQKRLVELQALVEKGGLVNGHGPDSKGGPGELKPEPDSNATGLLQHTASTNDSSSLITIHHGHLRLDIVPYVELRAFLNHLRRLRLQLAPFYNYPVSGTTPSTDDSTSHTTPAATSRSDTSATNHQALGAHSGALSPNYAGYGGNPYAASPFVAANVSRHKDFPSLPANVEQLIYLPNQLSSLGFLKRINDEDCEPCLRLDNAPGLNWLSRRQVQSAILDGSLMIEPIFGGGIYDEEQVRQRAIGAPPAACAMCGKALVNVPLPGGGNAHDAGSWMSAASSFGASVNAMANSLPGRESTASPPPTTAASTSSTNASSTTTNVRDSVRSRSSIFNTLRNISGGASRSNSSTEVPSVSSSTTVSTVNNPAYVGVPEDPFAPPRPPAIPTHIFRVSETSAFRYLLCPNYCLRRLRSTCDFWGYIRNLERAVVLEGKFAFDDESSTSNAASLAVPSDAGNGNGSEVPRLPTKDSELSKGNLTADEAASTAESDHKDAGEAQGTDEAEAEKNEESRDGDKDEAKDDEVKSEEEETKDEEVAEEPQASRADDVRTRKVSLTQTGSDVDENDFADAQSQHSEDDPTLRKQQDADADDAKSDDEGKEDSQHDANVDAQTEEKVPEEMEEENASSQNEHAENQGDGEKETGDGQKTSDDSVPSAQPPPLPKTPRPRAVPSRPVPSTPPTLPPRRGLDVGATPKRTDSPAIVLGPEPKRLLPLGQTFGGNATSASNLLDSASASEVEKVVWEEKVWIEVNRLRADMWSARIGVEQKSE